VRRALVGKSPRVGGNEQRRISPLFRLTHPLARGRKRAREPLVCLVADTSPRAREESEPPVWAKLPKRAPMHTRRETAKEAGVGERTYDAGKLILEAVEKGEVEQEVLDRPALA
jgi:hypothetical protein